MFVCVAAMLACAVAAAAKEFTPGSIRICNHARCVPIVNAGTLRALSAYYYGDGRVTRAPPVLAGAPAFQLQYEDGYVSGIVAGARLDRFRAYGFYCGRFQTGKWYRVPRRLAADLRALTATLRPARVGRGVPRSC